MTFWANWLNPVKSGTKLTSKIRNTIIKKLFFEFWSVADCSQNVALENKFSTLKLRELSLTINTIKTKNVLLLEWAERIKHKLNL